MAERGINGKKGGEAGTAAQAYRKLQGVGKGTYFTTDHPQEDVMLKLLNPIAGLANDLMEVAGSALGSGFIAEFVRSESGEVSPKQGFPVAWTGGLLVAAMVVLGMPEKASAACPGSIPKQCSRQSDCKIPCHTVFGCDYYCDSLYPRTCVCR